MEKLHTDIVENILDRLPIQTVLAAKQVCKTWKILLRSKTDKVGLLVAKSCHYHVNGNRTYSGDQFDLIHGKMKYNYSYHILDEMHNYRNSFSLLPYPGYQSQFDYDMLGSCNGLVCIQKRCYWNLAEPFLICNPITGEVVHVPKTNTYRLAGWASNFIIGFGYCDSKNEYKIVRTYTLCMEPRLAPACVQVYTIGGDREWRKKECIINIPESGSRIGIYANGSLHWLDLRNSIKHKDCSIIAFDLEDEKFHFIAIPCVEDVQYKQYRVNLLGGDHLYLVHTIYQNHCTNIWAYKRKNTNIPKGKYKDTSSWHWIKEFNIEWEETFWKDVLLFVPIAITRYDEFLLLNNHKTLYCYDLKTSTMNQLLDGDNMINVIPHANSIVSMSTSEDLKNGSRLYFKLPNKTARAMDKIQRNYWWNKNNYKRIYLVDGLLLLPKGWVQINVDASKLCANLITGIVLIRSDAGAFGGENVSEHKIQTCKSS
ncbi:F-box protein At3g07870-like [Papaver somniferum]|uniref:F-box protein At3g07870-like n=1 Tax=Papaver somniferum TaxID=3469 RepID=UPI000E6FDFFF|nr:F-box protein At3g07870-like [Papaver somniferum]